jgi:probable rRNA maturation factor
MITLSFENYTQHTQYNIKQSIFSTLLKRALAHKILTPKLNKTEKGQGTIALTIVDDQEMQKINNKHRQIDKPTDVLSFSYLGSYLDQAGSQPADQTPDQTPDQAPDQALDQAPDQALDQALDQTPDQTPSQPGGAPENLVGEIIISIETAEKQAKDHEHTLENELKKLFVHGLLHIFGYDHGTDQEEDEMEALASDILT